MNQQTRFLNDNFEKKTDPPLKKHVQSQENVKIDTCYDLNSTL